MTRMRRTSAAAVAVVLGLTVAVSGCGKYSWAALRAQKAYKEANQLYQGSQWKDAAEKYESAIASDPN
jgi:outer membrane protein assembly factor BamD (BamD/ComL family)